MDIATTLTMVALLSSIVSGMVEWLKALFANSTWDDNWDEDLKVWVIRTFAGIAGVVVASVAQFDVIHVFAPASAVNVNVCYVLSGILLMLPADGLKTGLQWLKMIRDAKAAQVDAERPPAVNQAQTLENAELRRQIAELKAQG